MRFHFIFAGHVAVVYTIEVVYSTTTLVHPLASAAAGEGFERDEACSPKREDEKAAPSDVVGG